MAVDLLDRRAFGDPLADETVPRPVVLAVDEEVAAVRADRERWRLSGQLDPEVLLRGTGGRRDQRRGGGQQFQAGRCRLGDERQRAAVIELHAQQPGQLRVGP
jgi:hypothetical protein